MTRRSEYREYLHTLRNSHRIDVKVALHDQNEDFIKHLDVDIVSGQVDVDVTQDVERSLSMTFADPRERLEWGDGGSVDIYADKFISVEYVVEVQTINKRVSIPVFFGPVTRFQVDGAQVDVEAQSKESLLLSPVSWQSPLHNAGLETITTDIKYAHHLIRTILDATGETKYAIGDFQNVRLPKGFKLPKNPENLWDVIKKIVQAACSTQNNRTLCRPFFDGRGFFRVENSAHGGFTFSDNDLTGVILNQPQVNFDLTDFRNTVVVKVNKGQSADPIKPIVRSLANRHPLSPHSLARNSKRRFIVEEIDNNNVRTLAQAKNLAEVYLRQLSTETIEVSFDSLPIPHLQAGSRCVLKVKGDHNEFNANQFSIPLRSTDSMSVGYTKRMKTGPTKPIHKHSQ